MKNNIVYFLWLSIFIYSCDTPPPIQEDHSYMAIDTARNDNGELVISATGWGIKEYGFILISRHSDSILKLNFMGECATGVTSKTWKMVTLNYTLSDSLEKLTDKIIYYCQSDSLILFLN